MRYSSTKTYGHDVGLSCAFRQWRADHSHCSYVHGYALAVHLQFSAETLDERGWVADFGAMKDIKKFLVDTFDHKLVIAADDPHLPVFKELEQVGAASLTILDKGVGCEKFARYIFEWVEEWVRDEYGGRVRLDHVQVSEHGANSAIYRRG